MYNPIRLTIAICILALSNAFQGSALISSPSSNKTDFAQLDNYVIPQRALRKNRTSVVLTHLKPILAWATDDKGTCLALLLAVCSMLFWGSWANTLLWAKVRFELFFLDYMFGNASAVLVMALIMKPPTLDNIPYGHGNAVTLSVIAGMFYAAGTLAATNAIGLAGISLAVPVVMGMEFSLGVPLMLLVEGFGVPAHWGLSLAGVGAVLCAVALDAIAHRRLSAEQHDDYEVNIPFDRTRAISSPSAPSSQSKSSSPSLAPRLPLEPEGTREAQARWGSALHASTPRHSKLSEAHPLIDHEDPHVRRKIVRTQEGEVIKIQPVPKGRLLRSNSGLSLGNPMASETFSKRNGAIGQRPGSDSDVAKERSSADMKTGLCLAVLAGLCFACWPCLASIVEGRSIWSSLSGIKAISFATFYMIFIVSALVWAICMLPYLSLNPVGKQEQLDFWPSYLTLPIQTHTLGVMGGLLQGLGTVLSLQSGSVLGNAVSLSITRCSPVVAALWGWLYWGELHGASTKTRCIYFGMIVAFLVAVSLLGWASSFGLEEDGGSAPVPLMPNGTAVVDEYREFAP